MGGGVPAVEQSRLGQQDRAGAGARNRGTGLVSLADPGHLVAKAAVQRRAGRHRDLGDADELGGRRGVETRLRHDLDSVRGPDGP